MSSVDGRRTRTTCGADQQMIRCRRKQPQVMTIQGIEKPAEKNFLFMNFRRE